MVASVPELTMRIRSTDGTRSQMYAASSVSMVVGAPKLRPRSAAALTASMTSRSAWPSTIGPQEPT